MKTLTKEQREIINKLPAQMGTSDSDWDNSTVYLFVKRTKSKRWVMRYPTICSIKGEKGESFEVVLSKFVEKAIRNGMHPSHFDKLVGQ